RIPTATLAVVGPPYVRVDVRAEIAADTVAHPNVELAVVSKIQAYLHPITGGPDGWGWKFGRRLRATDLYKVIEPVPGVRYSSSLTIEETGEPAEALATNYFLIYSGNNHRIAVVPPKM